MQTLPCWFAIASDPLSHSTGVVGWVEEILRQFAQFIKIILEFVAIIIIAIAAVNALHKTLYPHKRRRHRTMQQSIRLEMGLSLAISLEFLLAADIVGTAVSPRWQAIAQLAAIAGIRTFLNFFLEREVRELQRETKNSGIEDDE